MTKTGTALYVHGAKYIYPNKQINFNVLYFRETTNASFLSQVSKDVRHFSKDNFNATQALVISWINMRWHNYRSTTGDTFQLVLVTDDTRTYAIVIFHRSIVKLPLSGYVEEFCGRELFIKSTMDPRKTSNIGVPGKNVYLLTKKCLYAGKVFIKLCYIALFICCYCCCCYCCCVVVLLSMLVFLLLFSFLFLLLILYLFFLCC